MKGRDSPLAMRQIGGRAEKGGMKEEGTGNRGRRDWADKVLCAKNRKKRSLNKHCSHSHVPRRGAPIAPPIPPSAFDFCPTYPSLTLPGAPRGHGFQVHGAEIFAPHSAARHIQFRPALRVLLLHLCPGFRPTPSLCSQTGSDGEAGRREEPRPSPRRPMIAPPGTWRVAGPAIGARDGGAHLLSMWVDLRLTECDLP